MRKLGGMNQSIGRFLITCMVIGFASLIAAGIAAAWSTSRTAHYTAAVNHTYEVALAISETRNTIEEGETARRGYLLTGERAYLDAYRLLPSPLAAGLDAIGRLTVDNPVQQANVRALRASVGDVVALRDRSIALVGAGNRAAALAQFSNETNTQRMAGIRTLMRAMRGEEQRLLDLRAREQRASIRTFYVTLAVAGVLLVLVAIASLVTILRYTRDLAASRDILRDFTDTLEEQVQERTADLSRANEEIQRFAYIVSHDLRSPLVNVMGFTAELEAATVAMTELIDRAEQTAPDIVTDEARTAAREDLPEAIGFIRTSTQKMDRLINAILKLSREGRRVIAPEPIDMMALVGGAHGAIQHLFDEKDATFAIEEALPSIVSDRLAVEQIVSNLIENAVKYLQPGRPGRIVMRGAQAGARISYEVEDNGRGIAASDHARVFDLFRRSGSQDQPGEGIGLAHVRALAYRLGGTIDVRSELGTGTTFRLSLPSTLSDPQEPQR
ncbi:MAG: CHASE3 domain-containing protein [Pseudomonadota bacterium]|nr:CHASE3 domain-containing protein [Pseudomonadota bacterium]